MGTLRLCTCTNENPLMFRHGNEILQCPSTCVQIRKMLISLIGHFIQEAKEIW